MTKHWLKIALLIFPIMCGCSTLWEEGHGRYSGNDTKLAGMAPSSGKVTEPIHFPWELWQSGQGLRGEAVTNLLILDGDTRLEQGDRKSALDSYQKARTQGLSPSDQDSAAFRVAAVQLSLRDTDGALRTLSDFFRGSGRTVNDVAPEFSLLFGYAYDRHGDVDQALAWLTRARTTSRDQGRFSLAAEDEAQAALKGIPAAKFEEMATAWDNDDFIRGAFARERERRAHGGQIGPVDQTATLVASQQPLAPPGETHVGVLLPLSGRFASLGRNVQHGIELAVAGQSGDMQVKVAFQDTGDSSASAVSATQTLISSNSPSVVLGPLISEQAGSVRSVVENAHVPLICFSKRGDFIPGGDVFRLGVTADSQIESLLQVAQNQLGITRIALVYPQNEATQEVAALFRSKINEIGLTLGFERVYETNSPKGAVDVAADLQNQDIDAIFFVDGPAAAANVYAALPENFRKHVRPLGIGNWDSSSQLMSARNVLNGAVYVSPFFAQSTRPIVQAFVNMYQSRYQQAPDFLAAQGFDAATLALQVVKTQQQTHVPFGEALRSVDTYDGLTGKIYVGSDGELRRAFPVIELREKTLVELNNAEPEAGTKTPAELATPVVSPPLPESNNSR